MSRSVSWIMMVLMMAVIGMEFGCQSGSEDGESVRGKAKDEKPVWRIVGLPVEMRVRQRDTMAVPGSEGRVLLTLDDITRNQVMTALSDNGGHVVMAQRSMAPGDVAEFEVEGVRYALKLRKLDNALIGEDYGTFVIAEEIADVASADDEIEALIEDVANLTEAEFIRNGGVYTSVEAAAHLRMKWESMRGEIDTVEEFIEKAASWSSLSGEAYRVRWPNGNEMELGAYLRQRAKEMKSGGTRIEI